MGFKEERKLFIAFLKKWFFPDFTNRVTWLVVSVGIGILATPTPLKLELYNWLVRSFNLNSGVPYTLPELNHDSAGNVIGVLMVALGLFHNLAAKYINNVGGTKFSEESSRRIRADTELYNRFIEEFPSNSGSAVFLRDHDLGNSYEGAKTKELENFYYNWCTPESSFLTEPLQKKKTELWTASKEFLNELAVSSGVVNGNVKWFSVVPDMYMGHYEFPDFVTDRITKLNAMATNCHQLHQELIELCKAELKC